MAKYHCWLKYFAMYHFFEIIKGFTTLLELEFKNLESYMKLELIKIEFPKSD